MSLATAPSPPPISAGLHFCVTGPVPPRTLKWGLIYAATAAVCLPIGLTKVVSDSSRAWHAGAMIVILGVSI